MATSERLRPRDLQLLTEESPTNLRHNATVEIFEPGADGFDFDRFLALVGDRVGFVPRYRQRLQRIPGRLANPVWVDDEKFDLDYHVRRSALPRPGTEEQLRDLVARIVSRPLDRHRPLWEIYVVEGLEGGQVAILSKAHQVLVDGIDTVDLGQVLLDDAPDAPILGGDEWRPARGPSAAGLLLGAVRDSLTQHSTAVDTVRSRTASVVRNAERVTGGATRAAAAVTGRRPERETPISGRLSQQRRVVGVVSTLEDHRVVREAHGGTVNDVILATIAGGLRGWLMTRAESLSGLRQIRAVVPVSVIDQELEATSLGSQIAAHFVDLPIGEPSPVVRLHQVSYSFQAHKEAGRGVAANRLAGLAGFAATTFHAIGGRVAAEELRRRTFHVPITNVPGPQAPLYAAGARMVATYPIHPLLPKQALAFGVTSYDGRVFYSITADRDLVPDADVLAQCLREALDELLDTATGVRPKVPRGRRDPSDKTPSET